MSLQRAAETLSVGPLLGTVSTVLLRRNFCRAVAHCATTVCLQIKCLDEVAQQVELTNISPIPALIHCFVRSRHGYFTVQNSEMILDGGASVSVHVIATFLEAVASTGQLVVSAIDGQSVVVHLRGKVRVLTS